MKLIGSISVALLGWCMANAVQAADIEESVKQGAGALFTYSRDNENFYTQRVAVEYLPQYTHADALTGIRYTEHRYEQNSWSRSGKQLSILHRQINPATANGWQIETGIFSQGQHELLTADANYRLALAERTGLEIFINRDWVETATALDNGVHFTFTGASIDPMLSQNTTLVGVAGLQSFSDGNSRHHGRAKLIYQPDPDLGLTLQLRYRAYSSASNNVNNAYFNPSQYDETMLALGWRQKVNGWMANLTAGAGQQKVASDPLTPTRLLELGLQSPPSNKHYAFRVRALMSQSASFNGPDYQYSFLQGEWIVTL